MSNCSGCDDCGGWTEEATPPVGGCALAGVVDDPVRRVVHLLLGLYLLPVLVVVLAVGGVLIVLEVSARWVIGAWRKLRGLRWRYEARLAPLPLPSRPTPVDRLKARALVPREYARRAGTGRFFE